MARMTVGGLEVAGMPVGTFTVIEANPILTVAGTFSTGDYVGTTASCITFTNCAGEAGGTGWIPSCELIDSSYTSVAGELWLFDHAVTPPADNAAWIITKAQMKTKIGIIPFNTFYAAGTAPSTSTGVPAQLIPFKCAAGSKDLYGCHVTRGAPVLASLDYFYRLNVIQE